MNGGESEFWYNCTRCNTYVNTYIPQKHQAAVHEDTHTYIGNFGGYGTGKTTVSREDVYKHCFITPNANVLIAANVRPQYEQTIKRELEADLPLNFIRYVNNQKEYIELINGARIMFRPLDDPDKLRSLNLTMAVILEASETDAGTFTQLKTRTRNMAASRQKTDGYGRPLFKDVNGTQIPDIEVEWQKIIIESNPGVGWIKSMVLNVSEIIHKHGKAIANIYIDETTKDKAIASHVTSTDCNAYLPADFIENNCKNKPSWWIARYIHSSFDYAEGLVYPNYSRTIVDDFQIPAQWKRIIACDYGLSDNLCYLFGAVDSKAGVLYIYKEVVTNDKSVADLAALFHNNTRDIPLGQMYCSPILDPKSGAKRDYNKKTLYDHFADYGIFFKPGHVSVDARIFRLNTYIEAGRLKIMKSCRVLISELEGYKYPEKQIGVSTRAQDKPIDKNNHCINPLEWITMELPNDPKNLMFGAYDNDGLDLEIALNAPLKDRYVPYALRDEPENTTFDLFGGGALW